MTIMSAIVGIYHLNNEPVPQEHSNNLMNALDKFPADDAQTWQQGNIFLGCRSQWITPESVNERLPFYDHEKKLAITADAIIDNRPELFERLQVEQSYRKKIPDSELILLAYLKWGSEVSKYLIGDFAFMILDGNNGQLFGARDFSGGRTLYYHCTRHRFAFCTVIQPLLTLPYIEKKLNEHWLAEFLAIPGMLDAADVNSTVYKNIHQLPPAHSIIVSADGVTLSRYCRLVPEEPLKLKSNHEYVEAFREVFRVAVSARLRTRHDVGARLSGGLDSGSVVSFAAPELLKQNKRLYTFSYIPVDDFEDWTPKSRIADERPLIQATVNHVGNIKDQYLNFTGRSPLTEIDDLLEILEMPYKFIGNSFWLKGIFEEASRQQIGVLLSGGRGNYSISWGPAMDYYVSLLKKLNWIRLYREIHLYSQNLGVKKSRVMAALRSTALHSIARIIPWKKSYPIPQLINSEFARSTGVLCRLQGNGIDTTGSAGVLNLTESRLQRFEQLCYWNIPGTSATKLSLQYSLWERDPTNDLNVIRFCLSVPEEQFVQNGLGRALVRRATDGYLPDKVRLNQRIRGIQGADAVHRMAPSWKQFIAELQRLCDDDEISRFFNVAVLKDVISKVENNPKPEYANNLEFKFLMRSLVVYRFLKTFS